MKTIYLFRHSMPQRMPGIPTEELPLSDDGRRAASGFFQMLHIDKRSRIYASPFRRAQETALLLGQPVTDARLAERETGRDFTREIWLGQYTDSGLRGVGGESFQAVRRRMTEAMDDILSDMAEGRASVVVSHAAAICAYLQQFCGITVVDPDRKHRRITFREKVILDGPIEAPSCFVLTFDGELADLSYYKP